MYCAFLFLRVRYNRSMNRLAIFILLLSAGMVACKSKKQQGAKYKKPQSKKEIEAISQKLNIEVKRNDNIALYRFAADWLGVPHKLGKCERSGVDCSCFVQMLVKDVYNQQLPRTAAEMHDACKSVNISSLQDGDLVFFQIKGTKVSHVGVYLKEGWFVHVSTSKGVMINNLDEKYYKGYLVGAGRY